MNNELNLKNKLSKEDFKRYFADCPKVAWLFYSLDNFKQAVSFKQNKVFQFHTKVELDSTDEFDTSSGFDPFSLYEHLLTGENLSAEELEQREAFENQFDGLEGFDINSLEAETIVDGNLIGSEARAFYRKKLRQENKQNQTNFESYSLEEFTYDEALSKTELLLAQPSEYKVLFEPAFQLEGGKMRVKCDVLINHGDKRIEIIEVKASSRQKKAHFYDLFYQWYVLTKLGYTVENVSICLINSQYYRGLGNLDPAQLGFSPDFEEIDYETEIYEPFIKKGFQVPAATMPEDIDLIKLFTVNSALDLSKVSKPSFLEMFFNIANTFDLDALMLKIAEAMVNSRTMFNEKCEEYKFDYKECTLKLGDVHCKNAVDYYDKSQFNIFSLPRFKKTAAEIYCEHGLVYMRDLKKNGLYETLVNKKENPYFNKTMQRLIDISVDFERTNRKDPKKMINLNEFRVIKNILRDYYNFPVYMYDFETSKWAIPNFNNSKTYQQIPFQYSIHVLLDKDYDYKRPDTTMVHYNFIADKLTDPRQEFLNKFILDSFAHGPGVYVAYNKSFERMVLKDLMIAFPQYYAPLKWIYQNTIDLMDFFRLKGNPWLIYDPEFRGSASIKVTQPTLDSALSYKDLRINKGDKASATFRKFIDKHISVEVWAKIIKEDMLKYCDRDTLAMVVVLQSIVALLKTVEPDLEQRI